jgi:hypothetical protein
LVGAAVVQWYDAVIESIEGDDLYLVTFTGYGNQEVVGLGDMMLPPGAAKDRSRSRCDRGASGSLFIGPLASVLGLFIDVVACGDLQERGEEEAE